MVMEEVALRLIGACVFLDGVFCMQRWILYLYRRRVRRDRFFLLFLRLLRLPGCFGVLVLDTMSCNT